MTILSPARRHFIRKQAEANAKTVDSNNQPVGNAYELMKAALIEHRRQLHDIQSIERKIEFKREILPEYTAYLGGVLAADAGANDDVLTTVLVWYFDIGDLTNGLHLAHYAIKHNLTMPDQYKRSVPAIAAEESATAAMIALGGLVEEENTEQLKQNYQLLQGALELTEAHDMHDQIKAKLNKALGSYAEALGELEAALGYYERALELNANVGVKKNIQQIKSAIKKQAE